MTQEVPTESETPTKRKKKEITFARPAFAAEVMTEEGKKRFDDLPAWQRHLVKRLLDHGDLSRAATEAGVGTYVGKEVDQKRATRMTVRSALDKGGLTAETLIAHLVDCLEAETIKFDKHSNPIRCVDKSLKLKVLEVIFKLRGDFDKSGAETQDGEDLFDDTPV